MSDNKYGRIFTEEDVKQFIGMAFVAGEEAENDSPTSAGGGEHGCDVDALFEAFDGEEFRFPEDEPMFVMRGQDRLALGTLRKYQELAEAHECDQDHLNTIEQTLRQFEHFRVSNPDKIKKPDQGLSI